MNLKKNYYEILGIKSESTEKEVKKAYYSMSFKYHPDKNKEADPAVFSEMTEAYDVLCGEGRVEYDLKSRYGSCYNEYYELFKVEVDTTYDDVVRKRESFKSNEMLDVYITVDDSFKGSVEYERWIKCKDCDGTGKDFSSKIVIRDVDGNVLRTFDADDGCDFCEGSGKYMELDCSFCSGKGKVGMNSCAKCVGEKRILGKQKLKIKLTGEDTRVEAMGNHSKSEPGKVGALIIKMATKK